MADTPAPTLAAADSRAGRGPDTATGPDSASGPRTGVLFTLGLVWLLATGWAAHVVIGLDASAPTVALSDAANALAAVVAAGLVAGAAAGSFVTGLLRSWSSSPVRRLALGLGAGLVLGAASTGLVLVDLGHSAAVTRVAVTVGIGVLLGGAACALPRPVLTAGLVGAFGALVLSVLVGLLQARLVDLFGAEDTATRADASVTVAYLQALVCGALAGILAFWSLRGNGPRAWPWYLLAGLFPGLALLLTELLTRIGGGPLLDLVRSLSDEDAAAIDVINFGRLRGALLILFVGGVAMAIAVGRAIRAAAAPAGTADAPADAVPDSEVGAEED